MLASLVSWSFSLIFSALLAREVAQRVQGLGLSRDRCGGVPRRRQRLGARPVVVRCADHGRAGVAAGRDREHQWRDSVGSDDWAVAEPRRGGGAHRRVDGISFFSAPSGGHARSMTDMGVDVLARDERHRQAADAGRVARIQPAAHDRRVRARLRLSRARGPRQGCGRGAGSKSLRIPVPDGRHVAALAAEVVRAGDRCVRHAGRRRADPVSDVRGYRADAHGVGARD